MRRLRPGRAVASGQLRAAHRKAGVQGAAYNDVGTWHSLRERDVMAVPAGKMFVAQVQLRPAVHVFPQARDFSPQGLHLG